jgi:hypothetical protein
LWKDIKGKILKDIKGNKSKTLQEDNPERIEKEVNYKG